MSAPAEQRGCGACGAAAMLLFCPGCGNGLIVEEGQRCHRFACNTCPYVHNITRKVGPGARREPARLLRASRGAPRPPSRVRLHPPVPSAAPRRLCLGVALGSGRWCRPGAVTRLSPLPPLPALGLRAHTGAPCAVSPPRPEQPCERFVGGVRPVFRTRGSQSPASE